VCFTKTYSRMTLCLPPSICPHCAGADAALLQFTSHIPGWRHIIALVSVLPVICCLVPVLPVIPLLSLCFVPFMCFKPQELLASHTVDVLMSRCLLSPRMSHRAGAVAALLKFTSHKMRHIVSLLTLCCPPSLCLIVPLLLRRCPS
jgi:hypothetical protein